MSFAKNFRLALILGGARSGKSRYALDLAGSFPPPRLYLATAEAGDEEMAERIARHRRDRSEGWDTVESPLDLAEAKGHRRDGLRSPVPSQLGDTDRTVQFTRGGNAWTLR